MKKIKNGDIIRIPLSKEMGFGYAKYIDLLSVDPETRYPSLIRVYNFRNMGEDIDVKQFNNTDLLLSPILIAGAEPAIRKKVWKVIGNLPVTTEEEEIPDYKYIDESKHYFFVKKADISKKIKSSFENTKHLEPIGAVGAQLIGTKIAMALLKDEGKDVESFFQLKNYYEQVFFEQLSDCPPYYKQPEFMRGKAVTTA